ncbi:Nucleoporin Nup37 [Desmophyllum pertusum]|uniref:Nucleoporin Nup37 n=1 Tax=Desmophyllum pertusum TaxID=174260 RepID=A0A9W9YAJ6_9CNID|nr:Nucleoporin Nup37 [Desmophyllum pertusum]
MPSGNQAVPSTFSFESVQDVTVVEFCPFDSSAGLIAYGGENRVSLGMCLFQEESEHSHLPVLQFQHITDFHHGTTVHSIAWSPKTNIQHLPYSFQFCTAGDDRKLRYFVSDGRDSSSVTVLEGHLSYINDCIIEPVSGLDVASVSDDHTCRLWDLETGKEKTCIPLGSSGVSVKWNPSEPNKLMVAEKNGIVRFYDLLSQQPIMSLSAGQVPLISADWSKTNALKVGAVAKDDWLIWDMSKSSLPEVADQAHSVNGVCKFRWSNVHDNLFATTGRPGNHINVYHLEHRKIPVSCVMQTGGGLSWHPSLPVCATGGGNKVHLWFLEV